MSVMSRRVLRSNTKVLPDDSITSAKKSRRVILQSYNELSNTPKESENEEVHNKKIKRKRIRRTDRSILIDDSCKSETTLNGQYNSESSNTKTKKGRRNKDCSLIFDSSSDYDSVFEDKTVSSKKNRKIKKFRLPAVELDDFQQCNQDRQRFKQQSDINHSKCSKEYNNISNVVNKIIKRNGIKEKTSKLKESVTLIPTDGKKKLRSNTSIESIYFTSSPMETNELPNLMKLTKCENNTEFKTETNFNARKSRLTNDFVYKSCTSEECDLKKEQQEVSVAVEKRISNSNELLSANGYFCSETITTPLKPSFSDDSSETFNLNKSTVTSPKHNRHVEDVSYKVQVSHVENNSDSEVDFNCCPKDPVQIASDFPMMIQNASVKEPDEKEETTANNSKKIWVQTKINSRTDNKNPNISMSVATVNCADIYLHNSENCLSNQSKEIPTILSKKERKRWTILEGNKAKKGFNIQMESLRKSLMLSRKKEITLNDNEVVKSRRSVRKRWSDELRRSVSALDISLNSKHDSIFKLNSNSDDILENANGSDKFCTNTRRSRFSSSNSIDKSANECPKTSPHVSIKKKLSNSNLNTDKRRTFEIQKNVNDSPSLMSTNSKISNGRRSRFSSGSSIDKSATECPEITPCVNIKNSSTSNHTSSKRRTFDVHESVDINSSKFTNSRRSKCLSNSSVDISAAECPKAAPHVPDNLLESNINLSKRRTFEIHKSVNDSNLLDAENSKISNGRRSRCLSDSSVDTSPTECIKTAPHVSDNLLESNINSSKRRTFEIHKSVNDSNLLNSEHSKISNGRHSKFPSTSSIDTSPTECPKTTPLMSIDNLSKSNYKSSKRRTFEIEQSVNDIHLLKLASGKKISNGRDYKDSIMLKKRNTYELEESVSDVNFLRTLSESTITDIGVDVLPSENSVDFSRSKKVHYENVTRRKVLDRPIKELEVANGHNSLINKGSKKVCFKNSMCTKRSMSLEKTFSPPVLISSTPKCVFQTSSAQKCFNTDKKIPLSRRRSKSADEGNTRITRIRMPNFAKIHQKAREKMENIVQLTERKAERAKLLLSGQKPNDSRGLLNSDNTVKDVKRSHKQLTFDSSKPSTSKGFLRVYQDKAKKQQINKESFITKRCNQLVASSKIPLCNELKPELTKNVSLKASVPEKLNNAEKNHPPKAISHKKLTHFGFKIRSDACSENKPDQIKALATKTKLQQDNRAEQRSILKGVRSNKRFDLLMKMRKK